jgi:hypothetical protein
MILRCNIDPQNVISIHPANQAIGVGTSFSASGFIVFLSLRHDETERGMINPDAVNVVPTPIAWLRVTFY